MVRHKAYNRETALYERTYWIFVTTDQAQDWLKFQRIFPEYRTAFSEAVVAQLKADINATDEQSRTYGTLGVLRPRLKLASARFSSCRFKPEHALNPDTLANYKEHLPHCAGWCMAICYGYRVWDAENRPEKRALTWCCLSAAFRWPPGTQVRV